MGNYKDAAQTLETVLELVRCIFREDALLPPLHHRESGDLYAALAGFYLNDGDPDRALQGLEKMVEYDTTDFAMAGGKTVLPLLRDVHAEFLYKNRLDRYQNLAAKLTDPHFASLQKDACYVRLLDTVTQKEKE